MKPSIRIAFLFFTSVFLIACKREKKTSDASPAYSKVKIAYAKGFTIEKKASGITVLKIVSPWPNAQTSFTYALVPREKMQSITLDKDAYDAIVAVPVERIVLTSTTHIPAIEVLGAGSKLVGFPQTRFISSKETRERIDKGLVQELGSNESINTEALLALDPDLVVGFGINNENKAYETIKRSNIPVVYNGDWTEETPLGKAEWIKFFAPFLASEKKADSIFNAIEMSYQEVKQLGEKATSRPTVLTGGLYKDVWYVAGGKSWMAQFLSDAHTDFLWKETQETGSLPLSLESVLDKAEHADFWLNPSLHTTQKELVEANGHYRQFDAFKNGTIYTHANTKGVTGGLLLFELGPNRPDLVLKDLIHIFHPELLPDHQPFFYTPLK